MLQQDVYTNGVSQRGNIHVVSCVDSKYLQHLGVLITSLFENKTCENKLIYHIVHDDLNDNDQQCMYEIGERYGAEIIFHNVANLPTNYSQVIRYGHVSRAGLYRLSVPNVLPTDVEKILYLDCDIVILCDIADLWNTDINNYTVAAVEDSIPFTRHNDLMMPTDARYFNSGMLLINLKKWCENDITNKVLQFMIDYPERRKYNDQDGLNAILHSQWLRLRPKYNLQSTLYYLPARRLVYSKAEYSEARKRPVIIHYTGVVKNTKPWDYVDIHPLKKYYYQYLKLTRWQVYKPKPKGMRERMQKCYLRLLRLKMKSGIVLSKILKTHKTS